jgi:carboxyl-terminal processing protease
MRGNHIKRLGPFIVIAVVVLLSLYVTFLGPTRGGLELDAKQPDLIMSGVGSTGPVEMPSLKTLYQIINLVQKRYIDASRIDARAMFVAAMRAVQAQVAKVLVHEEKGDLVIRLDAEEKRFILTEIGTPWMLLQQIKNAFGFLEKELTGEDVDFNEIEYAAINGMLQTLDPHSVFLDPDQYRDMKDKTQGKFGGLGIVISIRDGVLTIISPIEGTPAYNAGLKSGDQIVKIEEASTVNLPLNDAVDLLRGEPGTTVTVYILRKGWEEPRAFEIVRAIVKVESVESHLLQGQVAYVRIKDFQSNTAKDLVQQISEMSPKGVRGLVLDLRGCPGGLLEAAIQVSDYFLKSGVIVTTAGQGPQDRDVRRARDGGNEPDYPVVVLINGGSASASEIVAGALKNHKRALLVGERTFGKGSVQVLYDFNDGSALKLTTAQYLTPGDVSIQSVGVVPHVELIPMLANKKLLDLKVDTGYRESDLDRHFEDAKISNRKNEPDMRLAYLIEPSENLDEEASEEVEGDNSLPDQSGEFKPDFTIDLAKDLVVKLARFGGLEVNPDVLLKTIDDKDKKEEQKLVAALKKLGIDWRADPASSREQVNATVTTQIAPFPPIKAGDEAKLIMTVTNNGPGAFYRLLATSQSDFRPLDDREIAFGKVGPRETMERELKFRVPKDTPYRTDDVLWSFDSAGGPPPEPVAARFSVEPLDRPHFAYNFQMVDVAGGNGDCRLQRGESVNLVVDIENVGKGASLDTYATLKNLSGKDLFMIRGRESLADIQPGQRRRVMFSFELKPNFDEKEAKLELALADVDLRVYSLEKITIPIAPPVEVKKTSAKAAVSGGPLPVHAEPSLESKTIAKLTNGTEIDLETETEQFYRIRLDEDRVGWVSKNSVTKNVEGERRRAELVLNAPPKLEIEKFSEVVQSPTVRISGRAVDEAKVRSVYIFVGDEKVFFKSNTDLRRPWDLSFEADLPLKNGLNYLTIVAEETADLGTRDVIAIRRDRPDGMAFLLPRSFNGEPEPLGVVPKQ